MQSKIMKRPDKKGLYHFTEEELLADRDFWIKQGRDHNINASKETKALMKANKQEHEEIKIRMATYEKNQEKLLLATFGNGEIKGMQSMVQEMHNIFIGAGFTRRMFIGLISILGGIVALALGLKSLFK
jgi:hypothetical protein